ncbi:helix-turn-helix transcriptional regulator [Kitasatospora sp. NPDC048540]|uniref:helix-turn-helix domain-containing protein n=1 Tax=Kitasatospora sp. NPDC048540 TaxID=3155634 RepID=UPI0033DED455
MARKPRPIDPTEGPLQAFAYDLRAVREDAGSPTYRVLAARAGFGATTLSDAAGGVRQPSLEVTLAYVGACGGDVELWERRWHALEQELTERRAETESEAPADGDAPSVPAARAEPRSESRPEPEAEAECGPEPERGREKEREREQDRERIPGPTGGPVGAAVDGLADDGGEVLPPALGDGSEDAVEAGRFRRLPAVLTVVVVALAVGVSALVLPKMLGRSASGVAASAGATPSATVVPPCADYGGSGAFSGTTYLTTTRVRAQPSITADTLQQYTPGCRVEFMGYCIGEVVSDGTSGTPDMRWFQVRGGGVTSSAVIHGNPPKGMKPTDCQGGVGMPSAISFTVSQPMGSMDTVELRASGAQLGIVGYAGYFVAGGLAAPNPQWQQIGFTDQKDHPSFVQTWRLGPVRSELALKGDITVVAVACMGGEGPTGIYDARHYRPGVEGELPAAELSPAEAAAASIAACGFPRTG